MAVVDSKTLELWLQSGLPDEGELMFNLYFRNLASNEWELSYKFSQYAALDIEINKRTDALQDIPFPTVTKDTIRLLVSDTKYKTKAKDLESIRAVLEQWICSIITRIDTFPDDLQILVEHFFLLPDGPNYPPEGSVNRKVEEDVDDDSHTESEDPSTISDDQDKKKKKKKKRIVKGIKKRMNRMFSKTMSNEDGSTVNSQTQQDSDTVSDIRDSQSTITSIYSDTNPILSLASQNEKHLVQTSKLLKSKVQRGGERSKGVFIYEITLQVPAEKVSYQCSHIFSEFVTLFDQIKAADGVQICSAFPPKDTLRMKFTERDQAERTRLLDCWIRDVIYSYQNMNESQQTMVKTFLGLDRDNSKCIFLHDKMFHGVVEAPRATYGIAARGSAMNDQPLTPPRTPRDSDLSEVPNTPSQSYLTPSAVNGAAPSETSTSSRPPLAKRSLTTPITASEMQSASNQHRKTAYRVKIVTSTSLLSRTPTISEGTNESSSSDGFNALPVSSGVSSAASHHQNKIEKLPQQQVKGPSKAGNQSQECCIIA